MEEEKEVAVIPSTEDVVQALLDYFVEPVLPPKRFFEAPPLDQQLSVAKQVHAVVLLYNYYQRKLQPELEFLNLVSFCELVAVLKPALMPFMKLMHQSDYSQLEGQENQLSPTEKAIQDGCDLCRILEASKCTPVAQGRPINKVAVLVIDSSMENCLLLHSAATQGVWSVIEKELDVSNNGSWGTVEAKCKSQKRRTFKLPRRCNQTIDTSGLKTLALLAVKEVAGINLENIKVLEDHVVYSLSEEIGAGLFYLMQYTQSTGEAFQVSIKDVVERLQGPVIKKTSNGWKASSVAEYFHLLPYSRILSDFISRTPSINSSDAYQATYFPNRVDTLNKGENGSPLRVSLSKEENLSFKNVINIQKQMTNQTFSDSSSSSDKEVDDKEKPLKMTSAEEFQIYKKKIQMETNSTIQSNSNKFSDEKVAGICSEALISSPTNEIVGAKGVQKVLALLTSEDTAITEIALRILSQKREELCRQQRLLEDKLDLYNIEIQKILHAKSQGKTHQQGEGQRTFHFPRDDSLTFQSPCQELDNICNLNCWRFPRYFISASLDGFVAKVIMKVMNLEFSFEGALRSTPLAARESAASFMISKLREMAVQE